MNDKVSAPPAASPEVFHQLGMLTRQLHDTLNQLGVMPKLRQSAEDLPDARSRLSYIARKTGEAAERVLNSVDRARQDHTRIAEAARRLSEAPAAQALAAAGLQGCVHDIQGAAEGIDQHLTEIMMAQDFHDLTGQVVAKVVALAIDLEDSLVKLLVQAAPSELAPETRPAELHGPVVNPEGRTDVVSSQSEVDDLLASLGF